jgi:hypothetical protein
MTVLMTSSSADDEKIIQGQWWIRPTAAVLIAIGTLSRLAALGPPHGRLLRQFMSEDGYLMQTVARNFALGHGLSVSDGTVATNGVQPLATFLFAIFHYLARGDKTAGIAGVMLFSVLVSLAAAFFLYLLAKKLLERHRDGSLLAMLAAALWFASPTIVKHSMNGLETGVYFLASIATVYLFALCDSESPERLTVKQMLAVGVGFGVCFLARNDAAFLIAALLGARFLLRWPRNAKAFRDRIVEAVVPGLLSITVALPWLIYNYRLFSSVVPISGISESLNAHLGGNLSYVPAPLFDFVTMVLPVPLSMRMHTSTILVALAVVAMALVLAGRFLWSGSRSPPVICVAYGLLGLFMITFYGAYFGASYFMSRYLAVLSPILAIVGLVASYRLLILVPLRARHSIFALTGVAVALLMAALNVRLYRNGMEHEHFQVVDWVQMNVPSQISVGAIQSGTLGYFHDKTVNLDGKVNPDALRARLQEGSVIPYVVRSDIAYLADWEGIAGWAQITKEGFNRKFSVIVDDKNTNLAVLKRNEDKAQ